MPVFLRYIVRRDVRIAFRVAASLGKVAIVVLCYSQLPPSVMDALERILTQHLGSCLSQCGTYIKISEHARHNLVDT